MEIDWKKPATGQPIKENRTGDRVRGQAEVGQANNLYSAVFAIKTTTVVRQRLNLGLRVEIGIRGSTQNKLQRNTCETHFDIIFVLYFDHLFSYNFFYFTLLVKLVARK